jgi:hypothetical protein
MRTWLLVHLLLDAKTVRGYIQLENCSVMRTYKMMRFMRLQPDKNLEDDEIYEI